MKVNHRFLNILLSDWYTIIAFHTLILLFIISLIRSIFTQVCGIPQYFIDCINNEFKEYLSNERYVIEHIKNELFARPSDPPRPISIQESDKSCEIRSIAEKKVLIVRKESSEVTFERGQVQEDEEDSDIEDRIRLELNLIAKIELIDKKGRRFCKYCAKFKPPRCHHCKSCQQCILKMDHHCQWIDNCVGYYNLKYFINTLSYGGMSLMFIVYSYSRIFYQSLLSEEYRDYQIYCIHLFYYFSITLMLLVSGFALYHYWLLTQNQTTIELVEKSKKDSLRGTYSLGIFQNVQSVLGTNILLWCLPIQTQTNQNGVDYQAIYS